MGWRALASVSSGADTVRGTNEPKVSESVGEDVALLLCGAGWD